MNLRKFRIKDTFAQMGRYRHIMAVLAKYGFLEVTNALRSRFKLGKPIFSHNLNKVRKTTSRPARVRLALEELGPTFVKFGQLLSTRPDLIPGEYIKELEHLQDEVAPEKFDVIKVEVEKELLDKLENLFISFDPVPLAAGSIAQVHKAVTMEEDSVVVKVRRPDIARIIQVECEIIEDIAGLLTTAFFEDNETIDPQRMVREFSNAVSKEVDLANERQNQAKFIRNFHDDKSIHVPRIYEKYCTKGVLTMEYIDGIKPTDTELIKARGLDPKVIAQRGANFVLRQVFDFGFFHADPHPGNFFLLSDNVLAPIDFGQVAHLSRQDRLLLNEILLAIVDDDAYELIRALEHYDMISEQTDTDKLLRDTELMFETYHNLPFREILINKIIAQIFDLIRKHRLYPPSQFTLMLKSLMTIESFAKSMDPDFEIIRYLKPYAKMFSFSDVGPKELIRHMRSAVREAGNLASKFPDDARSIISKFRKGQFQMRIHHEHLESLVHTLDKSSNRISFALIIAALLIGSSLLVTQNGSLLNVLDYQTLGVLGYISAAVIGVWLIISIIRSRHF